jgi:hypothetical protein
MKALLLLFSEKYIYFFILYIQLFTFYIMKNEENGIYYRDILRKQQILVHKYIIIHSYHFSSAKRGQLVLEV